MWFTRTKLCPIFCGRLLGNSVVSAVLQGQNSARFCVECFMGAMGFLRVLQGQDSVRFTPVCSSKSAVLKFYKDKTLFDFVWCALCENLLALLSHKDNSV